MFDLMHKEVILKNEQLAFIRGVSQRKKESEIIYLAEWWTGEGKKEGWFSTDEFSILENIV